MADRTGAPWRDMLARKEVVTEIDAALVGEAERGEAELDGARTPEALERPAGATDQ